MDFYNFHNNKRQVHFERSAKTRNEKYARRKTDAKSINFSKYQFFQNIKGINMKPKYLIEPTGQFSKQKKYKNMLEINKSLLFLLKYCIYTVQTYLQSKIRIQKCSGKSTCTVSGALGNDLKIKFDRLRTVQILTVISRKSLLSISVLID